MNKATIMGRLTREPELRTTQSNISVCSFTLAVDRRYKNAQGERETDFINCVAWRQQAELICRYFHKGERMLVSGAIQTRNWEDKDGGKRTSVEVIVDEIDFIEPANRAANSGGTGFRGQSAAPSGRQDSGSALADEEIFSDMDDSDTELPFDL